MYFQGKIHLVFSLKRSVEILNFKGVWNISIKYIRTYNLFKVKKKTTTGNRFTSNKQKNRKYCPYTYHELSW